MTVGKKALSIGFDNIGWLDGLENGPDDYCANAHAVARIGDEILEYEATVCATALYLLKSPSEDHREEVLAFADKVEAFYDGQPPREPAEDEHIPMRLVYSKSTLSTRGCEARMDPIESPRRKSCFASAWKCVFRAKPMRSLKSIFASGFIFSRSLRPTSSFTVRAPSFAMMRRAGLLLSERHGKWTYYRRNEKAIRELARYLDTEL